MKLGQAIKLCRTQKGLTQLQLAKRCTLSESYLSLIEKDLRDPPFSTIENVARGLEIPTAMLVFLAADGAELDSMASEVREKLSAAIVRLLQATPDEHQASLI